MGKGLEREKLVDYNIVFTEGNDSESIRLAYSQAKEILAVILPARWPKRKPTILLGVGGMHGNMIEKQTPGSARYFLTCKRNYEDTMMDVYNRGEGFPFKHQYELLAQEGIILEDVADEIAKMVGVNNYKLIF